MVAKTFLDLAGRTLRLGRVRPRAMHPRLRLRSYLTAEPLPAPPAACDYSPAAAAALDQMYLNDVYGCCVPAWMCHATGVFTGNAGLAPAVASATEVETIYHDVGGFDPKDPQDTDDGCDEETALAWWRSKGITVGGQLYKIAGRLAVDPADPQEVRLAVWLFENVMFGVELPPAWLEGVGPGFTWDVAGAPDPDNGHCFGAVGYSASDLKISTWGMLGSITDAAVAEYAAAAAGGQLFTVLSPDSIARASGRAPSGFDFAQLEADLDNFQ